MLIQNSSWDELSKNVPCSGIGIFVTVFFGCSFRFKMAFRIRLCDSALKCGNISLIAVLIAELGEKVVSPVSVMFGISLAS